MFVYCQVCGFITNSKEKNPRCKACENATFPVPDEFLTDSGFMFRSPEKRREFEKLIRQGELYDELVAENKETSLKEKQLIHEANVAEKVREYQNTRVELSCPVCRSKSLTKISNVGKIVKVSALGILGAGDIGKKYKCNSCGYRF